MITKILLLSACAGHLICWRCDWIITYTPNRRFQFGDLRDNEKMSALFDGAPLSRPLESMLLGVLALMLSFCGYLAIYEWVKPYSTVCTVITAAMLAVFFLPGVVHHVICGAVEWFYIRLGRTEEAREAILEFFKKTSVTMIVCYVGALIFCVTFFITVVSGATPLPRWACVCNLLPIFIVLAPFRIVGTFNLASAVMFLGLAIMI